ncbi:hypothetical protein GCM10018965_073740 [Nonomuraea roseola]
MLRTSTPRRRLGCPWRPSCLATSIPLSTRTRRAPRAAAATGAGKPSPKRSRRPAAQPAGVPLAQIIPSWRLALEEADKSKRTLEAYIGSANDLPAYLIEHDLPTDTEGVENTHIRAFLKAEIDRTSGVSAHKKYRALARLWKWIIAEGDREHADGDRTQSTYLDRGRVADGRKDQHRRS